MADLASLQFQPVTRALLIGVGAVTLPTLLQLLPIQLVYLHWPFVLYKYQIWRPITNFFYAGRGMTLLFDVFCLYQTSNNLESQHNGDTAAYVWMNTMLAMTILIFNSLSGLSLPFLFKPFLTSLIYIWSKSNPTLKVSIFGLISVPARLYPLVLIALDLVQGGLSAAYGGVMGVLAGHLWWFLSVYLPTQAPVHLRRSNPLGMPAWFRRQFRPSSTGGSSSGRSSAVRVGGPARDPRARNEPAAELRHRWGSGNRLGGSAL